LAGLANVAECRLQTLLGPPGLLQSVFLSEIITYRKPEFLCKLCFQMMSISLDGCLFLFLFILFYFYFLERF